jgi:hypothetical protein
MSSSVKLRHSGEAMENAVRQLFNAPLYIRIPCLDEPAVLFTELDLSS